MWDTIHGLVDALWPLLRQLTIGLRCCTALISAALATNTAVRRYRRRRNRQA